MKVNELIDSAYKILKQYNSSFKLYSHEDIVNMANSICNLPNFVEYKSFILNKIIDQYEENIKTKAYMPQVLYKNKNDGWFYKKKGTIATPAFDRYAVYLRNQDFSEDTIDKIEKSTEEILSMCANPNDFNGGNRKKKGLVVGDVQSGKTANYLALINMAADYGYKLIIVLAGLTDTLRIQTQKRIDSGFVGAKSATMGSGDIEYIGVGEEENTYYAIPMTNTKYDFNKIVKESNNAGTNDYVHPVVLVVKKNASVLNHVIDALNAKEEKLNKEMVLIIDDEADNASINTKKDENDPSKINACIRKIFNNYNIATYVGYTATPFANIFIDPQFDGDQKFLDLFPSDFIVQLESPDDYYGGNDLFNNKNSIRIIDELEEDFLPTRHSKEYYYTGLSESLKEAINCFIINNVLRTYDGFELKHRSMLINISIYNDIQEQIESRVSDYIDELKNIFDQDGYKELDDFIKNKYVKALYDLYCNDDFYKEEREIKRRSFDDIRKGILSELNKIEVVVFNRRIAKKFNYDDYENGARVIAIGGYVLSRGLTLEGLMVSYYNRASRAYDTLLQMCRWFGYRPKYKHLCRVYMTDDNKDNFESVLDAINNLKEQFTQMRLRGGTPEDFGLLVKESPDSLEVALLITANNKMRNTIDIVKELNYSGVATDTSKLYADMKYNDQNKEIIKDFYEKLFNQGKELKEINKRLVITDVSQNIIAKFVKDIRIPIFNLKFNQDALSEFIFNNSSLPLWDVVFVANGQSKSVINIKGTDYKIPKRSFLVNKDKTIIRIGGSNNRMINPGIFDIGLTKDQIEEAKNRAKKSYEEGHRKSDALIARDYLDIEGRKPILVISPMILEGKDEDAKIVEQEIGKDTIVFSFALGFPGIATGEKVMFRINKQLAIKLTEDIETDDGEEDDDEE